MSEGGEVYEMDCLLWGWGLWDFSTNGGDIQQKFVFWGYNLKKWCIFAEGILLSIGLNHVCCQVGIASLRRGRGC